MSDLGNYTDAEMRRLIRFSLKVFRQDDGTLVDKVMELDEEERLWFFRVCNALYTDPTSCVEGPK